MSRLIDSLASLIAPVTVEEFFADYYGKKHLYVPGNRKKFQNVMNWKLLDDLVNMTEVWSPDTFGMVLDRKTIPAQQFSRQQPGRDRPQVLVPDSQKVDHFLKQGASMVLNSIDSLQPGLRALASGIEQDMFGKSQMNLYYSWKQHQAFAPHHDTHDVFAVHCEGEKTWNIYNKRLPNPINHPGFKVMVDENKLQIMEQVKMTPGDFLYIPRGLYHDALADSNGCIHIAMGITYMIGVDVFEQVWNTMMQNPNMRANLPHPGQAEGEDIAAFIQKLSDGFSAIAKDPKFAEYIGAAQKQFHNHRGGLSFPPKPGK